MLLKILDRNGKQNRSRLRKMPVILITMMLIVFHPLCTGIGATEIVPDTLAFMKEYDYVSSSTTGISEKQTALQTLNSKHARYGTVYKKGMPYEEYEEAMRYEWEDYTDYENEPEFIRVDITKTMNYDNYEEILRMLSRYDGVYLYKIGESTEGRNLYAIEVDVASEQNKAVYMFTGQVHAREFAGGTFLVKMFTDIIQRAQKDDGIMELLKANKFVAVPIINVDGREALIQEPEEWTKSGELLKAYTNGTDGNRNFPGVKWGQIPKGSKLKWSVAKKPGLLNYPGDYAGSCSETKAMMKWLYHYTAVEKAGCLIDMHQQGSRIYAGKSWSTKNQEQRSKELRKEIFQVLNRDVKGRDYGVITDESAAGVDGGSTLTEYAVAVSCGAKFSPAMGFSAFTDGRREYMLMEIEDLDTIDFEVDAPNDEFISITFEIGLGSKYLGNSKDTRLLLAKEYVNYHFGELLEKLPALRK